LKKFLAQSSAGKVTLNLLALDFCI
jgi:hypothetical protein